MEGTICSQNTNIQENTEILFSHLNSQGYRTVILIWLILFSSLKSFSFLFDHCVQQPWSYQVSIKQDKSFQKSRNIQRSSEERSQTSLIHPVLDGVAKSHKSSPVLRTLISPGPTNSSQSHSVEQHASPPTPDFFFSQSRQCGIVIRYKLKVYFLPFSNYTALWQHYSV